MYVSLSVPAGVIGLLLAISRFPPSAESPRADFVGLGNLLRSPAFWLLGGAMALSAGVESCLTNWTANFIRDRFGATPRVSALALGAFALPMVAGRLIASRAVRSEGSL